MNYNIQSFSRCPNILFSKGSSMGWNTTYFFYELKSCLTVCEIISGQHSATSVEREDPVCTSLLWVIPFSPAAQSHAGQVNWTLAEPADVCVCEFVIMCLCVCVCHQLKKEDQMTDHVTGLSQRVGVFHPAESFGFIRFVFITQLPCFSWLTVLIMQPPN